MPMLRVPVLALTLFAAVVETPFEPVKTEAPCSSESVQAASADSVAGTWTAEIQPAGWSSKDRGKDSDWSKLSLHLQLRLRDRDWSNWGFSAPVEAFSGLPADVPDATDARFQLKRDAGVVDFDGSFRNGRGIGGFRFAPNTEFAAFLKNRGDGQPSEREMFQLAIHDVSRSFIQELEKLGYKNLPLDTLEEMRIHRVSPEFIAELRKLGYDRLSTDELVQMRIHRATPEFIAELKKNGFSNMSVDELLQFRIPALTDFGYTNLDADELVQTRIHGVTPEFVRELKAQGYQNIPMDELVQMRIHRVSPEFIRELAALGYKDIPVDTLVQMRIHRVDADFIKDVRADGYKDLSPRELIEFKIHNGRWMARKKQ
jgi:hypothetical protein